MIAFTHPSVPDLQACIAAQQHLPFSYEAVGATSVSGAVPRFDNDDNRIELGSGTAVFEKAKAGICAWRMFPGSWARIFSEQTPIENGRTVVMTARVLGIWWINPARIVYVVNEPRRFGFAYGTLPGHVERGEELFCVEMDADERVWYRIRAFSQPRHWLARLAYPLVRYFQRRFVRHSQQSMFRFVNA